MSTFLAARQGPFTIPSLRLRLGKIPTVSSFRFNYTVKFERSKMARKHGACNKRYQLFSITCLLVSCVLLLNASLLDLNNLPPVDDTTLESSRFLREIQPDKIESTSTIRIEPDFKRLKSKHPTHTHDTPNGDVPMLIGLPEIESKDVSSIDEVSLRIRNEFLDQMSNSDVAKSIFAKNVLLGKKPFNREAMLLESRLLYKAAGFLGLKRNIPTWTTEVEDLDLLDTQVRDSPGGWREVTRKLSSMFSAEDVNQGLERLRFLNQRFRKPLSTHWWKKGSINTSLDPVRDCELIISYGDILKLDQEEIHPSDYDKMVSELIHWYERYVTSRPNHSERNFKNPDLPRAYFEFHLSTTPAEVCGPRIENLERSYYDCIRIIMSKKAITCQKDVNCMNQLILKWYRDGYNPHLMTTFGQFLDYAAQLDSQRLKEVIQSRINSALAEPNTPISMEDLRKQIIMHEAHYRSGVEEQNKHNPFFRKKRYVLRSSSKFQEKQTGIDFRSRIQRQISTIPNGRAEEPEPPCYCRWCKGFEDLLRADVACLDPTSTKAASYLRPAIFRRQRLPHRSSADHGSGINSIIDFNHSRLQWRELRLHWKNLNYAAYCMHRELKCDPDQITWLRDWYRAALRMKGSYEESEPAVILDFV